MSHFTTLVIGEDPEAILAPYNENIDVDPYVTSDGDTSTYNPKSKWDWYSLGGRWTGFYIPKVGATVETGTPGVMTAEAKQGTADRLRKRDIDWDAMRRDVEIEATATHNRITEIIGDARLHNAKEFVMSDVAQIFYLNDPDPLASYVADRVLGVGVPFAIATADGWTENGSMGWFGMVRDEKSPDDWRVQARAIMDAAADDDLFSLYDLHI